MVESAFEAHFAHARDAHFIGRRNELERLQGALDAMREGFLQVVLLTGEAGVGKTRLAREFAQRAARAGWQVWAGGAQPQPGNLAFAALAEVFRSALGHLPARERKRLASDHPYLRALLPELGEFAWRFPPESAWERTRVFETLRSLALRLSARRPAIVWIDDLPEADADTIEWLQYFFGRTRRARLLFLGTCRLPQERRAAPFHLLQGALARHGLLSPISVEPLRPEETEALVRGALAGDVCPEVARTVHEHTLGVPFFIVEWLQALLENGGLQNRPDGWELSAGPGRVVPHSVAAIVAERMDGLPASERNILDFLAVSQAPVPWTVLRKAAAADAGGLARSLGGMVKAGLLAEEQRGRELEYAFRHPLMREAARARIPDTSLRQLHKELAAAWNGDVLRAGYHMRAAGSQADPLAAARVLLEAGRRFLSLSAYGTAAEYLEQAALAAAEWPGEDGAPHRRAVGMALCEAWVGMERADDALDLARRLFDEAASDAEKIQLKLWMAKVESTRSYAAGARHIEEGLRLWDGRAEDGNVLRMLNERVFIFANAGDLAGAEQALASVRSYAEAHPSARSRLLLAIREAHLALLDWTRVPRLPADADALLADARSLGEIELIYDAHCLLGYCALNRGDSETAARRAAEGLAALRRSGMIANEISLRLMGACGAFLAGDWQQALRETEAVERVGRECGIHAATACALDFRALLFTLQGHGARAAACMREAEGFTEFLSIPGARAAAGTGTISAARAAQRLLEGNEGEPPQSAAVVWANTHGLPVFLQLLQGMLQIRSARPRDVLPLIRDLRRTLPGEASYCSGAADLLDGLLLRRGGDEEGAAGRLERATAVFDRLGLPFETALARLEWASAPGPRRDLAESLARQSGDGFRRLGAAPFAAMADRVRDAAAARAASRPHAASGPDLSAREREVAMCVAQGLSTRQIAQRLTISPRTVTTHIENIFKKWGVNSRLALIRKMEADERLDRGPQNT